MELYTNSVKARLMRGEQVSAAWLQLCSNISAEIMVNAGFDALCLDMEHSPCDFETVLSICQATRGTDTNIIVRTPWNDLLTIKRVLDAGAHGLHVPYVSTKEEAEMAVKYSKYAPLGIRGIAGSARAAGFGVNAGDYLSRANDETICMVAIETPEGIDNLPEMMKIDAIDGIFIGPLDLSAAMGIRGQFDHPDFKAAIKRIEDIVIPSKKFLATIGAGVEGSKELYDKGYNMIYMMSDSVDLNKTAIKMVNDFKAAYPAKG